MLKGVIWTTKPMSELIHFKQLLNWWVQLVSQLMEKEVIIFLVRGKEVTSRKEGTMARQSTGSVADFRAETRAMITSERAFIFSNALRSVQM